MADIGGQPILIVRTAGYLRQTDDEMSLEIRQYLGGFALPVRQEMRYRGTVEVNE
jgi:hypothetical protein